MGSRRATWSNSFENRYLESLPSMSAYSGRHAILLYKQCVTALFCRRSTANTRPNAQYADILTCEDWGQGRAAVFAARRSEPLTRSARRYAGAGLDATVFRIQACRPSGGESSIYLAFISSTSFLACYALPGFCMKMADCETTTGHVGRFARTLMNEVPPEFRLPRVT